MEDTILWVENIADSINLASIHLVVKDKTGECLALQMYNQVDSDIKFSELQKVFPKGIEIGLKNPYLLFTISSFISLKNDNPGNIVFREEK